ncbi:helix-turn-helix domain-containing protein [Planococcus lenghuensis]|uniref:HTH luxR-type domain-containing protein n=1 Tax=Planococcus lenghuensis TaxID=2213202 RepID=A0A1Q2KXB7_9BACL|nr:helix-turn-helix transcriptional regulator [Planococcus lenghuensis]AQQ52754.1 hypothetical protein B0X71_06435 [Planococcus lenghuensis]
MTVPMTIERFAHSLTAIPDQEAKIKAALQGFFSFFPFSRLSLFSYSPLNFIGEGLFFFTADGRIDSAGQIREDVRTIPAIHEVIRRKRATYVELKAEVSIFPEKYVEQFALSSVLIVPLWQGPTVIGCVFIDRYSGEMPFGEGMIQGIEEYFRLVSAMIGSSGESAKLSRREVEVLEKLSAGHSTKEMAVLMGISEFTARDYISSAMKKLNVRHRAQAIAEAVRSGLIS